MRSLSFPVNFDLEEFRIVDVENSISDVSGGYALSAFVFPNESTCTCLHR